MPTHKGEGTWAIHKSDWAAETPAPFLWVRCDSFLGFWIRCGRVKLVSSGLGSILGVIAELRMPTHKGEGTWVYIVLSGWGATPLILGGTVR